MDTTEFDKRIAEIESNIESCRGKMEPICREFVDATKSFAVTWCKERTELAVKSKPEVIKQIGKDGVSELKGNLEKLYADLPNIVEEKINQDKFWSHRKNYRDSGRHDLLWDSFSFTSYQPRESVSALDKAIQEVLESLKPILVKKGLVEDWYSSKEDFFPTKSSYDEKYSWSEEMMEAAKRYSEIHYEELSNFKRDLKAVNKEKIEAEANDLWNQ